MELKKTQSENHLLTHGKDNLHKSPLFTFYRQKNPEESKKALSNSHKQLMHNPKVFENPSENIKIPFKDLKFLPPLKNSLKKPLPSKKTNEYPRHLLHSDSQQSRSTLYSENSQLNLSYSNKKFVDLRKNHKRINILESKDQSLFFYSETQNFGNEEEQIPTPSFKNHRLGSQDV